MAFRFCPFCGGVRPSNHSNPGKTVPLKGPMQSDDILDIHSVIMNPLTSKTKSFNDMDSMKNAQKSSVKLIGYKPREHKVIENVVDDNIMLMAPSEDGSDDIGITDEHTVDSSLLSESIRYDIDRTSRGGSNSYDYDHDLEGSEDHSHFSSNSTVRSNQKEKEKEKEGVNGMDLKIKRRTSRKWKPRKPKPAKNVRRNRSQTRERRGTKGWD